MTDQTTPDPAAAPSLGRTLLAFTTLRVALFLGGFGIALICGLKGPISLVIGLAVSAVASFALMGRQREQIAAGLQARGARKAGDRAKRREALDTPEA